MKRRFQTDKVNPEALNIFVARIKSRLLYKNKNWLAIVCGETGSGKSYSAISIAKLVGGRVFIVFTALEFLELLNSGKLQRGDVIIFDEAGVGMSSREWYSVQNKLLGSILQTFRNLNLAVIFTVPNLSFVDVQARKLFHTYLETAYLDYEKEIAFLRVHDIQVNSRLDRIYYKKPKVRIANGVFKMSHLAIPKPDPEMLEYYEGKKTAYTQGLNARALAELKGEGKPGKVKPDENKIVLEIVKDKDSYLKTYNKRVYLDSGIISNKFGIGRELANRVKKRAMQEIASTQPAG